MEPREGSCEREDEHFITDNKAATNETACLWKLSPDIRRGDGPREQHTNRYIMNDMLH